jgi:hypothetical protein
MLLIIFIVALAQALAINNESVNYQTAYQLLEPNLSNR